MIETIRLTLRPIGRQDVSALHTLFRHPQVYRYLTDGKAMPREWVDAIIADSETAFAQHGLGLWQCLSKGIKR